MASHNIKPWGVFALESTSKDSSDDWSKIAKVVPTSFGIFHEAKVPTIETPAFKAWFKKSKVIDSNGDPMPIHHGSDTEISKFGYKFTDNGNDEMGSGFYFTTNEDQVHGHTTNHLDSSHSVYLSLQNPLDAKKTGKISRSKLEKIIMSAPDLHDRMMNWVDVDKKGIRAGIDVAVGFYESVRDDSIIKLLNDISNTCYPDNAKKFNQVIYDILGYDGVYEDYGNGVTHWVAWFTRQIKSISNDGTFKDDSDDINKVTATKTSATKTSYTNSSYTNSPEFKAWFGTSRVVDRKGKPLMVFHGSNQPINRFLKKHLGLSTNARSAMMGFFFTSEPDVAAAYADLASNRVRSNHAKWEKESKAVEREIKNLEITAVRTHNKSDWRAYEDALSRYEDSDIERGREDTITGQNTTPVYLKILNPLIADFKGSIRTKIDGNDLTISDTVKMAKKNGHDGLIFKNIKDTPKSHSSHFVDVDLSDHYVVFKSSQIKSAIGNKGSFNPKKSGMAESKGIHDAADPQEAYS